MTATFVVRHQQRRHAVDRRQGADVGADPVGKPLRPRRLRIGEVRGTEHGDEDLRRPPLAGEAVDHHRHAVARVVDEQFVAVHRRPVGLDDAAVTLPVAVAGLGEQAGLQGRVREFVGQRPAQACGLEPPDGQPHCRGRRAHPPRNLAARQPSRLHPDHIAHTAHRKPLRRHPGSPFAKPKGLTLWEPEEASSPGRHHPGMVGDIISERVGDFKSEWWARSSRNAGRHRAESAC